ncbi:MAG: CAP domain-containing protein [Vagococcus sp.]|uniref:CAP domain-containing protein n=1 Tax=Vagococcus sp. TaxID=1933889 RepID=UPI002FC6061E
MKKVKLTLALSMLGLFGLIGGTITNAEEATSKEEVTVESSVKEESISVETSTEQSTEQSVEATTETKEEAVATRSAAPVLAPAQKAPEGDYIKDGSYIQITKKNYEIWENFKWEKKGNTTDYYQQKFKAEGRYQHRNGATYYEIFDNKGVRYGLVNAKATEKVGAQGKYISDGSYIKIKNGNYSTWQNFDWKKKVSANSLKGQVLKARGRYEHFNGSTYYSIYDNKGKWYGYLSAAAVSKTKAQGDYISDGSYVKVSKKNYDTWQNFSWKKKSNTNNYYGKILKAKGRYKHFNGSSYYSLYDNKDRWCGYLNVNAVTKTKAEGDYIKDGRYVKIAKKNYDTYNSFKWSKKGISTNLEGQILQARGRYQHFNGSTYYSLYDDLGNWRGYINAGATTKSYKQAVELSPNEIKKAQAEMLRLVNNERKKNGVQPVKRDDVFDKAANFRARELKQKFSSSRPDGTNGLTAIKELGVDASEFGFGENSAYTNNIRNKKNDGKKMAQELFGQWVKAKKHKELMLSEYCNYAGFGFYVSQGMLYGVQTFVVVW